jgi:lysophospholipase L1-like esterase
MRTRRVSWCRAAAAVAAAAVALTAPAAQAAAGVLVDETFGAQTSPPNFGFPAGAGVGNGVLNVTSGMADHTTSIKPFDTAIAGERTLDLTFDWKTAVSASGAKTGVELRDDQGNLVFSLAGTATELRYGLTGPVSNSASAPDSLNPAWTKLSYDRGKWYTVTLHLDFTLRRVQYLIATRETASKVMTSGTATITGGNLARLVACDYYGAGVQSIDNFRLTAPANPANGQLKGRSMYAFGDSIVAGHTYPRGFANLTAEREAMNLTKYAVNGATVSPGGNQILTQVRNASAQSPDYVVFDGGTNDAYANTFNRSTYTSALDTTVRTMKTKWPNARIVYVAVHKLGSRDWNTQLAVREATLQVCAKYGVTVADLFNDTTLDTRVDSHRVAYTFNGLVNGYPGTDGTGTHPNLAGITSFYVPTLTSALVRAGGTGSGR